MNSATSTQIGLGAVAASVNWAGISTSEGAALQVRTTTATITIAMLPCSAGLAMVRITRVTDGKRNLRGGDFTIWLRSFSSRRSQ